MLDSPRRLMLSAAAAAVMLGSPVADARQDQPSEGYVAVVTGEVAPVRAGADEGYYPLAELKKGQMVFVVGEKLEWAQVRLDGPAFRDLIAYLKFDKTQTPPLRFTADGKTALTLGLTPVKAPNLVAKFDARDSWKTLATLGAGTTVTVLDSFETELDRVFTIRMPASAAGFVSHALLDRATPEQVLQWQKMIAAAQEVPGEKPAASGPPPGATAAAPPVTPVTPPAVTPAGPATTTPPAAVTPAPAEASAQPPLARDLPPATPKVAPPPAAPKDPEAMLEQLDQALQRLAAQPLRDAEVTPLRNLYLQLSRQAEQNERVHRYATARAAQLEIWSDLQDQRRKLEQLQTRVKVSSDQTASTRMNFEAAGRYAAVGRLVASTIYTGDGLPRLLRLQDPATGRTVAYLRPTREFDLVGMLGQLIGVTGRQSYDPGLRLQIIEPQRVDILAPQQTSM